MNYQNSANWGRDNDNDELFDNRGEKVRGQTENIRLFVTLKRDIDSNVEYKKLTVMAPISIKISMLKRHVEREFSDLFPHEPTFICAKLEDEFGYSLSNTSQVQELLKNSDRVFAIPEIFSKDLIGKMHVTHDLNELTFMLKSIQQTIIAKLAEAELGSPENQLDILQLIVPIGFSLQQKAINHNTALTLKRIVENERLDFFQDQSFALIFNLLVKMLTFWINDLIFQDSFLLNITVDILEIVIKSAKFATAFKNAQTINSLMSVSKLDFVSSQTRSRIIKLISFLSRPTFTNMYEPRPYDGPIEIPGSRGRRRPIKQNPNPQQDQEPNSYQPSLMDRDQQLPRRPNSIRGRNDQNEDNPQSLQSGYGNNNQNNQQNSQGQLSHGGHGFNKQIKQDQNNSNNQTYQQHSQINNQKEYLPPRKNQSNPIEFQDPSRSLNQRRNQTQDQSQHQPQNQPQYQPYNQTQNPTMKKQQRNNDLNFDPQNQVFEGLVQDYLNLLSSESSEEMLIFAVQNLSDGIEQSIHSIMDSKEAYQQCVNLLEIAMPPNYLHMQIKVLESIANNMNESRAKDGMSLKVVQRIMKAFTYQPKEFHGVLFELLSAHLQQSDFQVDISTIISLIESPYIRISHLGIKILSLISDSNRLSSSNLASQFENYVKQIMDWALNGNKGDEFQYNALITLSNLSLNDIVRPQILYLKGIEFFLKVLRESHRVDAQRAAAKALLNLSIKSRETKLAIVSELEDEIKLMQKGDLDAVVQGYLQTLITTRDKRQML